MKKFDQLIKEAQEGLNQGGSAIDAVANQPEQAAAAPAPTEAPEPEQKPLTVEGKRFLIELTLKALAIDPSTLAESEKAIFNQQVTAENAEQVLNQLQGIIDQHS